MTISDQIVAALPDAVAANSQKHREAIAHKVACLLVSQEDASLPNELAALKAAAAAGEALAEGLEQYRTQLANLDIAAVLE